MVMEEERRREGIESMILEMVTGPPEQVAPCIRNALERGWEQSLPGSLVEFQQRRKEEIERVCSRYYSEFLSSAQELLTAKSRSAALKHQIVRFNEDIKHTGQGTLTLGFELQKQKTTRRNIQVATVVLAQCRELTSLLATAKQQIEDGRHYPALRTLDSISHQLSAAVDQPFIRRVQVWLPELATRLKAAALKDVAQWLVVIRGKSVSIGKGALRKCVSYMTGQGASGGGFVSSSSSSTNQQGPAPVSAAVPSTPGSSSTTTPTPAQLLLQQIQHVVNYSAWMEEDELLQALPPFLHLPDGDEVQIFSSLAENLDPLHRALHIHAHLGALDEIQQYYINNRLPQATLPSGGSFPSPSFSSSSSAAKADSNSPQEWVAQFQEALAYYAGFFVTEHAALRATEYGEGLLPAAKLEEAWWTIQRDLYQQLEAKTALLLASNCSPALLIQLKQTALLLAFTLGEDCFRFDTQPLLNAIRGLLRERYQAIQLRSLESVCGQILEHDVFQPMSLTSDKEYRALVCPYGLDKQAEGGGGALDEYDDASLLAISPSSRLLSSSKKGKGGVAAVRYPRTFAFSAVVPRLSLELYRMALLCFLFGLQLSLPAGMEATLLSLTQEGLATLSRLLNKELRGGEAEDANFPISKACQISVDAVTLAKMTSELERLLVAASAQFYSSTEAASKGIPTIIAGGRRELENTALAAQDLVFELIQRKIDELLGGMCFIEWEAGGLQTEGRPYVEDVVNYLQVTFMCLTYLPKTSREGLHFASCSHIHTVMLETLMDPRKVKAVNTNGLYNLSQDLAALEAFADSCSVLQLRECFAELRQTLGALLHRDINTLMLDAGLREGVYPKLQTPKLIAVLEKYKPLGLLAQVKNQQGGGGHGGGGGGVDLPYLDKKKVAEYLKALHKQVV